MGFCTLRIDGSSIVQGFCRVVWNIERVFVSIELCCISCNLFALYSFYCKALSCVVASSVALYHCKYLLYIVLYFMFVNRKLLVGIRV